MSQVHFVRVGRDLHHEVGDVDHTPPPELIAIVGLGFPDEYAVSVCVLASVMMLR